MIMQTDEIVIGVFAILYVFVHVVCGLSIYKGIKCWKGNNNNLRLDTKIPNMNFALIISAYNLGITQGRSSDCRGMTIKAMHG